MEILFRDVAFAFKGNFPELKDTPFVKAWRVMTGLRWARVREGQIFVNRVTTSGINAVKNMNPIFLLRAARIDR